RKRLSLAPPIKTRPPAVAIEPPRLSVPVGAAPFAASSSTWPSGARQAISPVFKLTALSVPQGGCWHGYSFGSQNRAYAPHWLERWYEVSAPAVCGFIAPTAPISFTLTKR